MPADTSSLTQRLLNVVAAPDEVFAEIRDNRYNLWNWLVPLTLAALVGLLFVVIAFSQPSVLEELMQQQQAAVDQQVASGKMTAAAAETFRDQMDKMKPWMATIVMAFGGAGAVVGTFAMGFGVAFALWLVSRFALHSPVEYWRCMEVTGVSSVINVISTVVTLILVVYKGSIQATPSAALLLADIRPGSPLSILMSAINPFLFWWIAILALGLSILASRSWRVTLVWLLGLYGVVILALSALAFLRS